MFFKKLSRSILSKLKTAWDKVVRENATPNQIASGFAIGLFTTFFPIPVIDTLAALAIAYLVRANKASCLIANNFVLLIPPLIPVVLGMEYLIGRELLGLPQGAWIPEHWWDLRSLIRQNSPKLYPVFVGGLVLATPSALIAFWGVRRAVSQWQQANRSCEEPLETAPGEEAITSTLPEE